MKKLLLFLFVCVYGFQADAQVWVPQATGFPGTSVGTRNISAINNNNAWVAAEDGSGNQAPMRDFSRTTDGGAHWTAGVIPAPNTYNWSMIQALDSLTAWGLLYNSNGAVGGGGVWKTTDGGASWNQQGVGQIFGAGGFPDIIHFWDANNGVTIGDPNPPGPAGNFEIYYTSDGGANWTASAAPPSLADEYGIVEHYSSFGDNIWFTTDAGRVFRSHDRGLTWDVSTTGMTVGDQFEVVFYSETNGVIRHSANGINDLVQATSDSGATWTTINPNGDFFTADVKYVPGTPSRLVSTGAAAGAIGSSYSDDGGLNWTTIETAAQRTSLGIVDSSTMWAGGFTVDSLTGGIFKWLVVSCGDASITPGSLAANDTVICANDTVFVTVNGPVVTPTPGDFSGFGIVVSTADLSGNPDPLNDPSVIASYQFSAGGPAFNSYYLPNDGTLPTGYYYWTPVVFGNATAIISPPTFLQDLALDPTCTYTGNSILVNVSSATDPVITFTTNSPLLCDSANFNINISTNNIIGATYSWTGPNGFTSSADSFNIAGATTADSGWYAVTVTNVTGCHSTDSTLFVVDPAPHATITPDGPAAFCSGDSVMLTATQGTAYSWSTGASSQSITVMTSGTYTVTVTDPNGCTGVVSSAPFVVTVNPLPPIPAIIQSNDSIRNNVSGSSYHWYLNGVLQAGFTTKSIKITPLQNGAWYVVVTNAFGCSSQSNTITTNVGIIEHSSDSYFTVYPNPGNGLFTVVVKSGMLNKASVKIADVTGRVIFEEAAIPQEKFTIDLRDKAKGVYYLMLNDGNDTGYAKLVIK